MFSLLPPDERANPSAPATPFPARHRWAKWRFRLTVTLGMLLGVAAVLVVMVTRRLPTIEAIRALDDAARVTTLYDVADKPLFTIFKEERIAVPLEAVSPHILHAVIAVEDERF